MTSTIQLCTVLATCLVSEVYAAGGEPSSRPTGQPSSQPSSEPTVPTSEPTTIEFSAYLQNEKTTTILEDYRLWIIFAVVFVSFTCVVPTICYLYGRHSEVTENAINNYFIARRDAARRAEEGQNVEHSEFREIALKETYRRKYGHEVDEADKMSGFISPRKLEDFVDEESELESTTRASNVGASTVRSTRFINQETAQARAKQIIRVSPPKRATPLTPQRVQRSLNDALGATRPVARDPEEMSEASDFKTSLPTQQLYGSGRGAGAGASAGAGTSDDFLSSLAKSRQDAIRMQEERARKASQVAAAQAEQKGSRPKNKKKSRVEM